jgi:hypothetical protein
MKRLSNKAHQFLPQPLGVFEKFSQTASFLRRSQDGRLISIPVPMDGERDGWERDIK